MYEELIHKLKQYAINTSHIQSVLIVGSYARGTDKDYSDIDIVIMTTKKLNMITNRDFITEFGIVCKKQIEFYGACTSIRVWYKDGIEVEFGIVDPSWISMPLDEGTYKVLSDGYKVVIDKVGYFDNWKI